MPLVPDLPNLREGEGGKEGDRGEEMEREMVGEKDTQHSAPLQLNLSLNPKPETRNPKPLKPNSQDF